MTLSTFWTPPQSRNVPVVVLRAPVVRRREGRREGTTRRTTSRCFSDYDNFDDDDFAHPVSFVGRRRGERGGGGGGRERSRMMRGGMVVSAGRDTRGFKTEATASTPDGSRANENDDDDFTGEIQKLAKAMDNAKRNERSILAGRRVVLQKKPQKPRSQI